VCLEICRRGEGNLFFFWRGQKEGREMLFLFFRWESIGQKTKCAFSFAVAFSAGINRMVTISKKNQFNLFMYYLLFKDYFNGQLTVTDCCGKGRVIQLARQIQS
jgi:hypothetical protein